jgi:hypothetical protein
LVELPEGPGLVRLPYPAVMPISSLVATGCHPFFALARHIVTQQISLDRA